jgi:hypothetical protein
LCGGPKGKKAREHLLAVVPSSAPIDDRVDALSRAVEELRALRDDELLRAFVRDDVRKAAAAAEPALRTRLRPDLWPPPPNAEPLRLSKHDRGFARAGL